MPPPEPDPETAAADVTPPEEPMSPDGLEPETKEPITLPPDELETAPEEPAPPEELLEIEPELEAATGGLPVPATQLELPLPHRFAATRASVFCRRGFLTGVAPLRVTTDHTPLVSV